MYFVSAREKGLPPHKTTNRIVLLYILISTALNKDGTEDNSFLHEASIP
jgi:hypothetical protein